MEQRISKAELLATAAAGLLTLVCQTGIAGAAESVPLPLRIAHDVGQADAIGSALLVKEIDQLIDDGRYTDAETKARDALSAIDAAGAGGSYGAAIIADRLVEALLQGGKWTRPETVARAEMAVQIKERLLGAASVERARSLERLGRVLTRKAAFADAKDALDRSLGALADSMSAESLDVATVRLSMASLACDQSHYQSANPWLEQALATREAVLGANDSGVAEVLRAIGDCATRQHEYVAAMPPLHRSRQIYEMTRGTRHPDFARTLTSLGQALKEAGDYGQAKDNLERAVAILEESLGPESPLIAVPLDTLAGLFTETANYPAAAAAFERTLEIERREYGSTHLLTVATLRGLAILHAQMGDYLAAADLFGEVGRNLEAVLGPSHPDVARAIENRGTALAQAGRLSEAEPLMARALEIWVKSLGPDNPRVAICLLNLAGVSEDLGNHAKARERGLQALAIVEKAQDTNASTRGMILINLANATRNIGDLREALRLSEQGETAMMQALGPFHPDVARAMNARARFLIENGQYDDGLALTLRAEAVSRDHLVLTVRTASEREALTLASTRDSSLNLLVLLATTHPLDHEGIVATAWDSVMRARALVLDEMIARHRTASTVSDPETARLQQETHLASERLAKLVIGGPGPSSRDAFVAEVAVARDVKDRAERALAAGSDEFRSSLVQSSGGLNDIVAALPADAALVAFARYEHFALAEAGVRKLQPRAKGIPSYAVFVLVPGRPGAIIVPLGPAASIDARVARWREATAREAHSAGRTAKSGEAAYRKDAEELRRVIWDPIAKHLGAATHVLVVPDGPLNLVTLAALPVGEARYLIEEGRAFHYLSAERDLLAPSRAGSPGGLLAFSDPDFDDRRLFAALGSQRLGATPVPEGETAAVFRGSRSACGSFQSMRFEPLPASAQEVEEITRIWGNQVDAASNLRAVNDFSEATMSFAGSAANETMFKRTASGHRVLHLATHGFFLGGDCESALDSPAADNTSSTSSAVTRENPLLLSGLVLAGANHRESAGANEDDGILTAEEIAALNLRGTEWAVLSACDTGNGEIRAGEGVFGLRRAFQLAGARTVIMSLWPVEDAATRQWMTALYRHRFGEEKTTAESVNDASRELLQQRRAHGESTHPFYWAGFIAAGAWQ